MARGLLTRAVPIAAIFSFLVALGPLLVLVVLSVLGSAFFQIFAPGRRFIQHLGRAMGVTRLNALNEARGGFKDLKVTRREALERA